MSNLIIAIKGNYNTSNAVHDYFLPKISPAPSMNILEDAKDLKKIFDEFNDQDAIIGVRASLGSGLNIDFDLKINMMIEGDFVKLKSNKTSASLTGDVDAKFSIAIDPEDEKQLKKAFSKSSLRFYVTRLGMKRETNEPYSFSNLTGIIKDGEWGNDDSWPSVMSFDSDIFKKKATTKITPLIKIPVKTKTKIIIEDEKLEAVRSAIISGIVTRVGLTIPGGSNSFFVKQEDWLGKANFSIKSNTLVVDIDAFINLEIDSWMKKYKSKSPFGVEWECILDSDSSLHYFGEKGDNGYFSSIKVGEISL
jgi:hypothetical protein